MGPALHFHGKLCFLQGSVSSVHLLHRYCIHDDGAVLRIEQSHFRLGQWYLQKSVLHLSYGIDLSIDLQRDGKEK